LAGERRETSTSIMPFAGSRGSVTHRSVRPGETLGARPEVAKRFLQEARAGRRIKSGHVASVFDIDTVDGQPFIVMEHLDGHDRADELRDRGSFPVAQAVDLLLQAGEAVGEAHSRGIVHRDLKLPASLEKVIADALTLDREQRIASVGALAARIAPFGVPQNQDLGARLFYRACELGVAQGCLKLSVAYTKGQGVPRDASQAFSYAERACSHGLAPACVRVASAKLGGNGVTQDTRGGLGQLDAMCTARQPAGCASLAGLDARVHRRTRSRRHRATRRCDRVGGCRTR
jgi:serine/threonine protein kinase